MSRPLSRNHPCGFGCVVPKSRIEKARTNRGYASVQELIERFLEEESRIVVPELDPMDRARFHHIVRQCAANWVLSSEATVRATKGKTGLTLQFDGVMAGKALSVFVLRADHKKAKYYFVGPNPDRARLGLSPQSLESLDRMKELYSAFLANGQPAGEAVQAELNGTPMPDLVPLVEETRRSLDGTHENAPVPEDSMGGRSGGSHQSNQQHRRPSKPSKPSGGSTAQSPKPEPKGSVSPTRVDPDGDGALAVNVPTAAVDALRLYCPEPAEVVAFYCRVLKTKAEERADQTSVIHLDGFELRITTEVDKGERRFFNTTTPPKNRGYGVVPTLRVSDFDLCLRRSRRMGTAVIHEDLPQRTFMIRDPAGYVFTIVDQNR